MTNLDSRKVPEATPRLSPDLFVLIAVSILAASVMLALALATQGQLSSALRLGFSGAIMGATLFALMAAGLSVVRSNNRAYLLSYVALLVGTVWMVLKPNVTLIEPFFSLRDQVVYELSSREIARTGGLLFEGQELGSYLGFRQVGPQTFTPNFLPGYSIYLSLFQFPGLGVGSSLANGLLFLLTGLTIMAIVERVSNLRAAALFGVLLLSSYATWWFFRGTWPENLLATLVWGAALALVIMIQGKRFGLVYLAVCLAALLIVRPEAILFVASGGAVVAAVLLAQVMKGSASKQVFALLGFAILLVAGGFLLRAHYAESISSAYLDTQAERESSFVGRVLNQAASSFFVLVTTGQLTKPTGALLHAVLFIHYEYDAFVVYGFLNLVLCSVFSLWRPNQPFVALSLFLAPCAFFLAFPSIAADQPWFLRRYYPIFLLWLLVAAGIGISKLTEIHSRIPTIRHTAATILCILVVLPTLQATLTIANFQEAGSAPRQLREMNDRLEESGVLEGDPILFLGSATRLAPAMHFLYDQSAIQDRGERTVPVLENLTYERSELWVVHPQGDSASLRQYTRETCAVQGTIGFEFDRLKRTGIVSREVFEDVRAFPSYEYWGAENLTVPDKTEHVAFVYELCRVSL